MGCDIHTYAEWRDSAGEFVANERNEFFSTRVYSVFAWLADVRNYHAITPVFNPRGFPKDASAVANESFTDWDLDAHTPSWITREELLSVNYDDIVEISENSFTGAATCELGEGERMPLREFLGRDFMEDLERLRVRPEIERIVFWFDN